MRECKCENREQLCKREGEVIRQIATINKAIAGRTKQQYREENKELEREKCREHYWENRGVILQRKKEWREKNDDKSKITERLMKKGIMHIQKNIMLKIQIKNKRG